MENLQNIEKKKEKLEDRQKGFNIYNELAYTLLIELVTTILYVTYCKNIKAYGNIRNIDFIKENISSISIDDQKSLRVSLVNEVYAHLPTLQTKNTWKTILEIVHKDIRELTKLKEHREELINKEREENAIKKLCTEGGNILTIINKGEVVLDEYAFITHILRGFTNIYYIIDANPILAIIITKCVSSGNAVNTDDVLLNMHTIEFPITGSYIQKEKISAKYVYDLFTKKENKNITGIYMSKPI